MRLSPPPSRRQGRHPGDDEAAGDRLQRARAALRVGREVSLSFSQSPATLAEEEFRAELAERLVSALDACPSGHLEGVAVVVGDKSGADHLGQARGVEGTDTDSPLPICHHFSRLCVFFCAPVLHNAAERSRHCTTRSASSLRHRCGSTRPPRACPASGRRR